MIGNMFFPFRERGIDRALHAALWPGTRFPCGGQNRDPSHGASIRLYQPFPVSSACDRGGFGFGEDRYLAVGVFP